MNNWNYRDDGSGIDWLQEREMILLPEVIAHEYRRIKELLDESQPYGALIQLKDAYETVLKFCVLAECARINEKDVKSKEEVIVLTLLTEKPLLLNQWKNILVLINDLDIPDLHLKRIIGVILTLLKG